MSIYYTLLLFTIFILIIFCKNTINYIYKRFLEKRKLMIDNTNNNNNNNNNDDGDDENKYYDINTLIKNNKFIQRDYNEKDILLLCKGMVLEIDDDKQNCKELSQDVCDGRVILKKITIPENSNIDFYSHSGYKLIKGKSYCIYKPPPVNNGNNECDETWGFWQYSLMYEMWRCKSKVPGIYNAEKNIFDACSKGKGYLYRNMDYIPNDYIPREYSPEQFYSLDFQKQFRCDCPNGYISRPEMSRTTCFKDPCLASLPPNAIAAGYDPKTGNCRCTPYFKNLYPNNLKSPCTMCPDAPVWDHINNLLIFYVKCGDDYKYPCTTMEDRIRGCIKTSIKVKPISKKRDLNRMTFEDLVFF